MGPFCSYPRAGDDREEPEELVLYEDKDDVVEGEVIDKVLRSRSGEPE